MTDSPGRPSAPDLEATLTEHRQRLGERVREYSSEASGVIRQLAYAGIALAWLFHVDLGGFPAVPQAVVLPLFLLGFTLLLDLLQYLAGVAVNVFRLDITERRSLGFVRGTIFGFLHRHPPVWWLFTTKALSLVAAYAVLLTYFGRRLLTM